MRRIGINTSVGFKKSTEEMIELIAKAGFTAFFTGWSPDAPIKEWKTLADKLGLEYTFIHAPFMKVHKVWQRGEKGDEVIEELKKCVDDCAENNIKIMICHAYIGFGRQRPTKIGINRFAALLDYAEEKGVIIAFENTEGEKYLEAIKNNLWNKPAAAFCIDTGHELCYNYGRDMIGKYGDKLVATHFNSNMGITGRKIFWLDDSHLAPFDGIADFEDIAKRIKKTPFNGTIMFELTIHSKPERNTNDIYKNMTCEEYLSMVYERGIKIKDMLEN